MIKRLLPLLLVAASAIGIQARELVRFPQAANNYQLYPDQDLPDVSKAPKGYENFHLEHYGRHGSRWLIGTFRHDNVISMLQRADTLAGGLNENGRAVLAEVKQALADMKDRQGELSDKGAQQHRGIAARMAKNFPTIFKKGTNVDARSTVIPRCILSMSNAVAQLVSDVPGININKMDASEADAYYMKNVIDKPAIKAEGNALDIYIPEFVKNNPTDGAYLANLFNDPKAAAAVIDEELLAGYLFDIAANSVSTGDQSDIMSIFSPEELDRIWRIQNAKWYIRSGNTPLTGGLVPLRQRNLLRNFIESADTAIVSQTPSANIRYGHEVIVIPFVCLLELNDYGKTYTCLLYTSPSPRDRTRSRMPSSA